MELTSGHFLARATPQENTNDVLVEYVKAGMIQVGDLMVSKQADGSITTQEVTHIDRSFKAVAIHAPITREETIVIYGDKQLDSVGLVASVFSDTGQVNLPRAYAKVKSAAGTVTQKLGITSKPNAKTEYGTSRIQNAVSKFIQQITAQ